MFPRKFSRKILFLSHFLPVFLQFCNRPVHILQAFSCKNACFPVFPVKIIQSCSSFTGLFLFTGIFPVFPVYRPVYRFIFVPKCKTGIQDRVQKNRKQDLLQVFRQVRIPRPGRDEEIFEKGAAEGAKKGREIEEKTGKSAKDHFFGGILSLQRRYIRNEC